MNSQFFQTAVVIAQSSGSFGLRSILFVLFFGGVGIFSLFGVLASDEELRNLAGVIGTENPRTARVVCGIGVAVGLLFAGVGVLAAIGVLS